MVENISCSRNKVAQRITARDSLGRQSFHSEQRGLLEGRLLLVLAFPGCHPCSAATGGHGMGGEHAAALFGWSGCLLAHGGPPCPQRRDIVSEQARPSRGSAGVRRSGEARSVGRPARAAVGPSGCPWRSSRQNAGLHPAMRPSPSTGFISLPATCWVRGKACWLPSWALRVSKERHVHCLEDDKRDGGQLTGSPCREQVQKHDHPAIGGPALAFGLCLPSGPAIT